MVESLDAFSTKTKRQPATLTADAGEISRVYGGTDTVEHFSPGNTTSHAQAKPLKHDVILVLHVLFGPISVQRATGKSPVGTGAAHGIRTV
jgi:hypothetical protein